MPNDEPTFGLTLDEIHRLNTLAAQDRAAAAAVELADVLWTYDVALQAQGFSEERATELLLGLQRWALERGKPTSPRMPDAG